ncbi:MAG: hypothetical protein R3256_13285 [Thalassovita sp.]|nr:hypothetical protein [Thalassovita sp.]
MATAQPPDKSNGAPAQPPQPLPKPHEAAPDKDHPVFPDYASI